ncbi:MAG: hypothetical protein MJH10_13035 [Epibacterium sp.]|nr:hypothetical protein [Epibacterium sp.]NQX74467.1 hypothetical protein [Epibacterium sp.]
MKARKRNGVWEMFVDGQWIEQEPPSRFNEIASSGKPPRMAVSDDWHWHEENGGRGRKSAQAKGIYATSKDDLERKLNAQGYTTERT